MHFINLLKPTPFNNTTSPDYRGETETEFFASLVAERIALQQLRNENETELQEEEQLASHIDAASDFISEHHMGERGAYAFDPCASCEAANRDIALATKRLDALRQQRGDLEEECTEPPDRDHPGDVYF